MPNDPLDRLDEKNAEGGADTVASIVAEFNELYCVVTEGGKTVVFRKKTDPILKRSFYERISFADFRNLYANRYVVAGGDGEKPVHKTAGDTWLRHPRRRQFTGGVVFDPSERHAREDELNLWEGFAVEPRPGDWSLLRRHIERVVCNGDPECHAYLMGWLARLVRNPAELGEVAVVMRGGEGVGKGILAKAVKRILGQHGLAISNPRHLTGHFNMHLRDTVFLFADEAFFAGDKAHVGALKALITESPT
jgi:Family of unknown function (DUF5906)